MATQYFLTDGTPPHPVRFVDDNIAEVLDVNGVWNTSNYRHAGRATGEITPCSEGEALAAAKVLVKNKK